MRKFILMAFVGLLLVGRPVCAQDNPVRLGSMEYEQIQRLVAKYSGGERIFPSSRTLSRKRVVEYVMSLPVSTLNERDLEVVRSLVNDSPEWFTDTAFLSDLHSQNATLVPQKKDAWLNAFYPYSSTLIFVRKKDFFMGVNPVIQWKYGRQRDGLPNLFENRKGLALRMGIENKIFIDTKIEELQFSRPDYINRYTSTYKSSPGFTFYTRYQSSVVPAIRGLDVLDGEAHLTFPIGKYAYTRFGYGREFIGNGIQSLLLSDFGGNYLHLNFDIQIWKLKYRYMIAELSGLSARQVSGDQLLPKKFMATHMLQFRLWNKAHLGLFESVVFNRQQQLEWHYLLPVIFFRTVERAIGSPDNILLGLDFKSTLFDRLDLYSQFVLDEFKSSELFGGNQWWANKWGLQLGAKLFDVGGINNLNATAEYNTVRPYNYSHRDTLSAYTHYNSPLAHPLGANFREFIGRLDYRPHHRWQMFGLLYHHTQGLDIDGKNYGSDIRKPGTTRVMNYGVRTLQGRRVQVTGLQAGLTFMLWHDAYLDLNLGLRREDQNNNIWGSVAFRLNTKRTGMSIF